VHPSGFHKKETVEFHPWKGALKSGDDLFEGEFSYAEACEWCQNSAECKGFTFENQATSMPENKVD
jgi:hypothetical protein